MYYLVRCSVSNTLVVNWIRRELSKDHPFVLNYDDAWDHIAPFATAYEDIHATVVNMFKTGNAKYELHRLRDLILSLGGNELRDSLIDIARVERGWTNLCAVRLLLDGWGKADVIVAAFFDEIVSWDNEKLHILAGLLPEIIADSYECRKCLLSLARGLKQARFDIIARGFVALGCTSDDSEVVDLLLDSIGQSAQVHNPGIALIVNFSTNPRVRQDAYDSLKERVPPLSALALSYKDDVDIRAAVLTAASSLPATLRGDIVEIAAGTRLYALASVVCWKTTTVKKMPN